MTGAPMALNSRASAKPDYNVESFVVDGVSGLGRQVEPQARMIEDRNDPLETTLWNGVDHGT